MSDLKLLLSEFIVLKSLRTPPREIFHFLRHKRQEKKFNNGRTFARKTSFVCFAQSVVVFLAFSAKTTVTVMDVFGLFAVVRMQRKLHLNSGWLSFELYNEGMYDVVWETLAFQLYLVIGRSYSVWCRMLNVSRNWFDK